MTKHDPKKAQDALDAHNAKTGQTNAPTVPIVTHDSSKTNGPKT